MIKHLFAKVVAFFRGHSLWKYLITLSLYALGLAIVWAHLAKDVVSALLGTVIGLIFSGISIYFFKICLRYIEDVSKVTDDTDKLKKIYTNQRYWKEVFLNGSKCEVVYNEVLDGENYNFRVRDFSKKKYELPSFVDGNFLSFIKAHDNSYIRNFDTIRLDDVVIKEDRCTFYLSRSNYYNHLATNRAVDFLIEGTTVREVLEYGPDINSLKNSKLSNHIGINGLVFLSDGAILIPRRKNDSTISKNKITSSIATMLRFPKKTKNSNLKLSEQKITKKYLFHDNLIDSLTDRLKIPMEEVLKLDVEVNFIGLGQNIYEGGKPQMYFALKINNLDSKGYYKLQNKASQNEKLDVDKCTYIVDYKSIHFVEKDKISFLAINPEKKKGKKHILYYEKSFACNLWHFENFRKKTNWLN